MNEVIEHLKAVKEATYCLMVLDKSKRNEVLLSLAARLRLSCYQIIEANKKDLAIMATDDPMYDRLLLSEERIKSIADDVELVAGLPHPLGTILDEKVQPNGLRIQKFPYHLEWWL